MAKARRKSKTKSLLSSIVFIVAVIAVILGRFNKDFDSVEKTSEITNPYNIHFIDVGQGSSTLLQSNDTGILIDAGEREYGMVVVEYLESCGIKKLDYVIATHPHTDHIGGLIDVLKNFQVDNIIMPKLSSSNVPTTKTYETLLELISQKNIKAIAAKYNSEYTCKNISFKLFGPIWQNDDLNNMSVICKADVNSTTVLISGDAEKPEMKSVMNKSPNLSCDIMLMGHHGSKTSLEKSFLKSASPSVAIISCGLNNSYGHPHEETIEYLNKQKIKYYRTDESGDIVIHCYDSGYKITTQK